MHFCKKYIEHKGLVFIKKMNIEPIHFSVADGHINNSDKYKAICEINGEEKGN
jgi:hypothetical protein